MKYILALDGHSVTGRIFADACHGYITTDGIRNPALYCSDLDAGNHYFVSVKTLPLKTGDREPQSLLVPHSSIG